jgi:hypothetical protein
MADENSGTEVSEPRRAGWQADLLRGLFYALLILASILFFSGTASRFIYVDF